MGKSIAKQVMTIADKRETERLKALKDVIHKKFYEHFQKRIDEFKPWEIGISTLDINSSKITPKGISNTDFRRICTDLGFTIKFATLQYYELSVPEWIEGEKRTPAQLLVYHTNIEINRKIKAERAAANEFCKQVIHKLADGDFDVIGIDHSENTTTYTIEVLVASPSNRTIYFGDEAIKLLEKRGFSLFNVWETPLRLKLQK